jgi:hypothetical protein
MEQSGRNRWRPAANRSGPKAAQTCQFAAIGRSIHRGGRRADARIDHTALALAGEAD